MPAQRTALDPRRWHWHHGPIDIVAEADGEAAGNRVALILHGTAHGTAGVVVKNRFTISMRERATRVV